MPASTDLEAADLVGRAEPVLDRPDQPQRGVPLALEVQHHVDEVLEHARTGDRAVLGDVADQDRGDAALLGHRDQRRGDLADLGDPAGGALDGGRARWSAPSRRPAASGSTASTWREHGAEVGLGREVELGCEGADAPGPQPHLRRRLLTGDDQRRAAGRAATRAPTSSSSVDLPTPGSPASRTTAPGTSPPPSTRSSSATPVGPRRAPRRRPRRSAAPARVTGPARRPRRAEAGAPTSSRVPQAWHSGQRPTHLAEPSAALGAAVGRAGGLHSGGGHGPTLTPGYDDPREPPVGGRVSRCRRWPRRHRRRPRCRARWPGSAARSRSCCCWARRRTARRPARPASPTRPAGT